MGKTISYEFVPLNQIKNISDDDLYTLLQINLGGYAAESIFKVYSLIIILAILQEDDHIYAEVMPDSYEVELSQAISSDVLPQLPPRNKINNIRF